ncbi:MAG: RHS repeat-associated core domain-containing protein, partial [Bacteroidales bacterium]|nr:RHS repeat-associated core domain-containing protein [Bacteroidales bacterium]
KAQPSGTSLTSTLYYRYIYDARNRLTESYVPDKGKTEFVYDADDRLGTLKSNGSSKTFQYNADGTMKTDGLRTLALTYNYLKLPRTVKRGTTSTVTYIYDAAGNKLAVSQDGTAKNYYCGDFVYDGSLAVAYILTPNGQLTRNPSTGAYTSQYNIPDHLGNVRSVVSSSGTVLQSTDYYPFGLAFSDSDIASNRYLYNGKELEDYTLGTTYLGTLDYGARHYDPRIARWTVPDPMAEKYYGVNAYGYCAGNPILFADFDGMNPIYDIYGYFLGTDDLGLQGEPIIMNSEMFTQGMLNADAIEQNLGLKSLVDKKSAARFFYSYLGLRYRPDWDGFVTISEGIAWAKGHPDAIDNPSPYNMLYIDASKLDYGNTSVSQFQDVGIVTPINLFNRENTIKALTNPTIASTVYALGRIDMVLLNKEAKTIQIVNDYNKDHGRATDYDWNSGGGFIRSSAIAIERR